MEISLTLCFKFSLELVGKTSLIMKYILVGCETIYLSYTTALNYTLHSRLKMSSCTTRKYFTKNPTKPSYVCACVVCMYACNPHVCQTSPHALIFSLYLFCRLCRPLLVCSIVDIGSSTALGDTLPYSLVLDYLFSHAPQELRSPHVVSCDNCSRPGDVFST